MIRMNMISTEDHDKPIDTMIIFVLWTISIDFSKKSASGQLGVHIIRAIK